MTTMRFRLISIILVVLLVLTSCEKDKNFPKKYVFDSFHSGDLKAYTKTGEITDELAIVNFIEGFSEYFWQSSPQLNHWQVEIEIISESKARISNADTSIFFDLLRKDGIIYFQSGDTLIGPGSLSNNKLKYSPLFIQSYPSMSGIPSIHLPCYYIKETNDELHVPFVSYTEKIYGINGDFMSSQGIRNYNNVFNTGYLTKIQTSSNLIDTIVYQDNTIIFKEK